MEAHLVLGLTSDASAREVRSAFRKLALAHHPDRGGDAREFIRIRNAYETLLLKFHRGDDDTSSLEPDVAENADVSSARTDTESSNHDAERQSRGGYTEGELHAIFQRIERELAELLGRAESAKQPAASRGRDLWPPLLITNISAGVATYCTMPSLEPAAWFAAFEQFVILALIMSAAGALAVLVASRPYHFDLGWYHAAVVFVAVGVIAAAPPPISTLFSRSHAQQHDRVKHMPPRRFSAHPFDRDDQHRK